MIPLLVQPISNEESTNILPVPWIRFHRCRFHGIDRLDDYQNVALSIADWSAVAKKADITVFNDHIDQTDALIERLLPFDVICVMRERPPLRRDIIQRLPRLRFIASTGPRNISIDMPAPNERGILFANTGYRSTPPIELTCALILASARHLVRESNSIRAGGWQT